MGSMPRLPDIKRSEEEASMEAECWGAGVGLVSEKWFSRDTGVEVL